FNVYPDDFSEIESDADKFHDDPFDSKGEKIKESELLIDQLDLPCDILPYLEYDSFNSQDFSKDDDLPSPDNEDNVFNLGILIHKKSVKIITRVAQEKKLVISYASLLFEDFDPPFYEPSVFKDVPNSMRLLSFSSKNEEKVLNQGYTLLRRIRETIVDKFMIRFGVNVSLDYGFPLDVITRLTQVHNAFPTHPTLQPNLKFQPFRKSLFPYVVWIFLPFLVYSVAPHYLLSLRNEDTIFDLGIFNSRFSRPDVSHRCGTFPRFTVLLESLMEIFYSTCSPMDK
nr:hypothetical protein [Tanacetum cinerariifolium]